MDGDSSAMEGRLVAILAADVAGYSRLIERDEADTFERLRAHRKELFEPEIEKHHGRIFKPMGNGLLAQFGSVVDANARAIRPSRPCAHAQQDRYDDRQLDRMSAIVMSLSRHSLLFHMEQFDPSVRRRPTMAPRARSVVRSTARATFTASAAASAGAAALAPAIASDRRAVFETAIGGGLVCGRLTRGE
jgi:hypothetical protein